jgi:hypothetical protein
VAGSPTRNQRPNPNSTSSSWRAAPAKIALGGVPISVAMPPMVAA